MYKMKYVRNCTNLYFSNKCRRDGSHFETPAAKVCNGTFAENWGGPPNANERVKTPIVSS